MNKEGANTKIAEIRITADAPTVLEARLASDFGTLVDWTPGVYLGLQSYAEARFDEFSLVIVLVHDPDDGITIEVISTKPMQGSALPPL